MGKLKSEVNKTYQARIRLEVVLKRLIIVGILFFSIWLSVSVYNFAVYDTGGVETVHWISGDCSRHGGALECSKSSYTTYAPFWYGPFVWLVSEAGLPGYMYLVSYGLLLIPLTLIILTTVRHVWDRLAWIALATAILCVLPVVFLHV